MADDTRRLLKVFGVAVTDFEAEADKLIARAGGLTQGIEGPESCSLLKDSAELCRELNTRWLEITQHVFGIQNRLLSACADAAKRGTPSG